MGNSQAACRASTSQCLSPSSSLTPAGESPLHLSIRYKYPAVLKLLTQHNFGINHPEPSGAFPIHEACSIENLDALEMLVRHGAKVNVRNKLGLTALHIATFHGAYKMVEFLLANGADPDGCVKEGERSGIPTPLVLATDIDQEDLVRLLLTNGANPDIKDMFGFTALHRATAVGDRYKKDISLLLIEFSNNICQVDQRGHSALSWALSVHRCLLVNTIISKMKSQHIPLNRNERIPPILIAIHSTCWECYANMLDSFGMEALDYGEPSPLVFAMSHPNWVVSMTGRPGGAAVQRANAFGQGTKPKLQHALELLDRFDLNVSEKFTEIIVSEALRLGRGGHAMLSLCLSISDHFRNVQEEALRVKEELNFELLGKREDRETLVKMLEAGFKPSVGNIMKIHHEKVKNNDPLDLVDLINSLCRSPRTLKNLSVLAVRGSLKGNIVYRAKSLDLPLRIYNMITLGFNDRSDNTVDNN